MKGDRCLDGQDQAVESREDGSYASRDCNIVTHTHTYTHMCAHSYSKWLMLCNKL